MHSIGLDVSALDKGFKSHAERGIGRYVSELKKFFDANSVSEPAVGYFDHRSIRSGSLDKLTDFIPIGRQTIKQQLVYPFSLRRGQMAKFSALHFPAHMDPPSWGLIPYIVTVLDLIPLVLEDLYRAEQPGWRFKFARFLELRAIQNAALILAISENTARDVERVLKIPRERIVVTPLGVDPKFFLKSTDDIDSVAAKYSIPRDCPALLYVGGIDPRKNVPLMLKALAELRKHKAEQGQPLPILIMAGGISSQREWPKVNALVNELGLEKAVYFTGYVSDQELLALFKLADIFFFPSLYEGVGLPPLEALAAGVPVVSSNTSAMPEVLGDAAVLVDPNNIEQIVRELSALLADSERCRVMSLFGPEQAKKFTWQITGQKTFEAYKQLNSRGN